MIYFVLSPETNTVKIGYTTSNVKSRLANLQTGNPVYLTLIQVIEGDLEKEKQLHEEFEEYRQQGEWFYFGEKLRTFITNLNTQTVTVENTDKKSTINKTVNKLVNIFNDECYKDKIKYDLKSGHYLFQKNTELVKFDFDESRKYILEKYDSLPTVQQLKNILPIVAEKIHYKKQYKATDVVDELIINHVGDNYIALNKPFTLAEVLKELDLPPAKYQKKASDLLQQQLGLEKPKLATTHNGKRLRWWNK